MKVIAMIVTAATVTAIIATSRKARAIHNFDLQFLRDALHTSFVFTFLNIVLNFQCFFAKSHEICL